MDIMNELPDKKYYEIDDLLAFISIYDDEERTRSFLKLLQDHRGLIRDAVCVEAGCGFGLLSEQMAKLGAKKVYAVETNPRLCAIARERLSAYPNITVVEKDIRDFQPEQPVDVLVHELFGQLLYDEDIMALEQLLFKPQHVLPNRAVLKGGCINSDDFDDVIDDKVLQHLDGVLVSGLYDDEDVDLQFPVIEWQYGKPHTQATVDLSGRKGDLLFFGLEIMHDEKFICRAGECDNWSYVWTPRTADEFYLSFLPADRGMAVSFEWERP